MIDEIMKKIMIVLAAVAAMVLISACDKYEDRRPSKDIINEFDRLYPDAWDIVWDYEGTYWEVYFETGPRPNGVEHMAVFDLSANWVSTKTELPLNSVPQKIKDYLAESPYGDLQYEDYFVDYYETPTGNFYRFDVHLNGDNAEIDVTEDGKVSVAGYGY